MTTQEKLSTVADNEQRVYAAGKAAQYDAFWEAFQQGGERTVYDYAFYRYGWNDENFKPRYDMHVANAQSMFQRCEITDLAGILEELGVVLDFSECGTFVNTFAGSTITHVGVVDTRSAVAVSNTFNSAKKLSRIDKLILKEDGSQSFSNVFDYMSALEEIEISGVIGKNGVRFADSPLLTHDSLMSILTALQDKSADTSGTVWTLTIGDTNKAKLTEAELATATAKGWVVS